jgi:EmrB/QacA subfamily drug resistance transporter
MARRTPLHCAIEPAGWTGRSKPTVVALDRRTGESGKAGKVQNVIGRWLARFERVTQGPSHKWWALAVVQSGILMATIDGSIVNIALPTIMHDFGVGIETVELVVVAYLFAITLTLLSVGRLADMIGRKRVVVAGYAIFTLSSVLCGLAPTAAALIGCRLLQALGAACLMANGMAITSAVFPRNERGRALGINGTIVATGTTIGPSLGGLLIQAFGWRSIFMINLPLGLLAVALGALVLREERISGPRRASQRFDFPGAVLSGLGLGALLLGFQRAASEGAFDAICLAFVVAGVALLGVLVVVERRTPDPLLDMRLFTVRAFSYGSVAAFLSFVAMSTNIFLMPFYLQLVLGHSPLEAGLMLSPVSLMLAFVAPLAGWLSDRVGSRSLTTLGLGCSGLGFLWLSTLGTDAHYVDVILRLLLVGLGMGLFQAPNSSAVLGATPRERLGVASGFLSAMRNLGMVLGTSLAAAVLAGGLRAFGGTDALRDVVDPATQRQLLDAYVAAQATAYRLSAGIAFVGMLLSAARGSGAPPAAVPVVAVGSRGSSPDVPARGGTAERERGAAD